VPVQRRPPDVEDLGNLDLSHPVHGALVSFDLAVSAACGGICDQGVSWCSKASFSRKEAASNPRRFTLRVPRLAGGRPRTRPDRVRVDKAYSSRAHRALLRRRRIGAVIAEPSDQAGHRRRRGSGGGRPPAFDSADYRGRNVVERRFCHLKQWRGLATRYDKLATVYRAAVVLNAVVAWTKHLSDIP